MKPVMKNLIPRYSALLLAAIGMSISVSAQNNEIHAADTSLRSQGIVLVPANTNAGLELRSIVNSNSAFPGQMIYCSTIYPIAADDQVVIPAGSFVRGHITRVIRPKRFKGRTELGMHFDEVVMPDGTTHQIDGDLIGVSSTGSVSYSEHEEAIVGQRSKAKDLAGALKTAAEWSTVGSLVAVNDGGSVLGGGTLGGAAGLVKLTSVLFSRGDAIVLTPGTNLEMTLESPLTYRANGNPPHSMESSLVAHLAQEDNHGAQQIPSR